MRRVEDVRDPRQGRCAAWSGRERPPRSDSSNAAAVTAKRKIFIDCHPHITINCAAGVVPTISTPSRPCTFRASAEGRHQFFQRRRKAAIGRHDRLRRRQFRRAVAGGGMSCTIGEQLRHFDAAALDHVGAAGMKTAARWRIERARHLALQHDAAALGPRFGHRESPTAARGYRDGGARRTAPRASAVSTITPRFITATRSAMCFTTARSCETKM